MQYEVTRNGEVTGLIFVTDSMIIASANYWDGDGRYTNREESFASVEDARDWIEREGQPYFSLRDRYWPRA